MESHAEFQRVNESVLVRRISSSRNDSMIAALSDPAIAYLETKEAALFDGAKLKDPRNEEHLNPEENKFYDPNLASDTLIGDDPAKPAQHKNSAEAFRLFLDAHKRALEKTSGMIEGDLDIFLFTHYELVDPSGTLNYWANVHFYHVPVATAIERLTRMKIAVRLMEHHALQFCPTTAPLPDSLQNAL